MEFKLENLKNKSHMKLLKSKIYKNGYVVIKNLISEDTANKICDIMNKKDTSHENIETILLRNKNSDIDVQNQELNDLIFGSYGINLIEEFFNGFEEDVHISRADAYKSVKSKKAILEWHNDKAFSGDKIIHNRVQNKLFSYKLFIHATKTEINNGCFSYLPNSNNISVFLRKAFRKNIIEYTPFWKIFDFVKILNKREIRNFASDCHPNLIPQIDEFLLMANKIILDPQLNDFKIPCNIGDSILFDERGFHQGGIPYLSERVVLRLFFLNGAGKYNPEPITDFGKLQQDNPVGTFKPYQ